MSRLRPKVYIKTGALAKLMAAKGLTERQVAEALGISDSLVNYWKTGKRTVAVEDRLRLLAVFNISFDQLFEIRELERASR